jgi:DNA-binding Lrp family transcriptional regulator
LAVRLTKFQERLCNVLQEGLPICARPFDDLARYLDSDEETLLGQVKELKSLGVIRRICGLVNFRALGMTSTLVAAHVPEANMPEVAEAVNSLENVSHNYRRRHHYNLWFTLQGQTKREIELTLSNLTGRFGIDFHDLSVKRVFKLDVRFDAEGHGQLVEDVEGVADLQEERGRGGDMIPSGESVELDEDQKRIVSGLQNDLVLVSRPFDFLCGEGMGEEDVLKIIGELIDKGVIRRIAGVVDHHKLGFVANVLFCSEVAEERVVQAGERLARLGMVSHCYERRTVEDWPYNLFAMMHSKSMGEIQHAINRFVEAEGIELFELLPTVAELKKQPVRYDL